MKPGPKNSPTQKTKHHLVPRSRCKYKEVKGRKNIRTVERRFHEAWHTMFANMTPFEVVAGIIKLWSPSGYFINATVRATWEDCHYEFTLNGELDRQSEQMVAVFENTFEKHKDLWTLLFKNKSFVDIIAEIVNAWSPEGYFQEVIVEAKQGNLNEKFNYTAPLIET